MIKILKLYFIIDNHTSMNIVENDKCCVFFINTLYFFLVMGKAFIEYLS